jgi:hypothetical protein
MTTYTRSFRVRLYPNSQLATHSHLHAGARLRCIDIYRSNRLRIVVLFALSFNASSQGLYRNFGYREVGIFVEQDGSTADSSTLWRWRRSSSRWCFRVSTQYRSEPLGRSSRAAGVVTIAFGRGALLLSPRGSNMRSGVQISNAARGSNLKWGSNLGCRFHTARTRRSRLHRYGVVIDLSHFGVGFVVQP